MSFYVNASLDSFENLINKSSLQWVLPLLPFVKTENRCFLWRFGDGGGHGLLCFYQSPMCFSRCCAGWQPYFACSLYESPQPLVVVPRWSSGTSNRNNLTVECSPRPNNMFKKLETMFTVSVPLLSPRVVIHISVSLFHSDLSGAASHYESLGKTKKHQWLQKT